MHAEDRLSSRITSGSHVKGTLSQLEDTNEECEDVETVGQQLREIGDDLDRGGSFRSRSASVVSVIKIIQFKEQVIVNVRYACLPR